MHARGSLWFLHSTQQYTSRLPSLAGALRPPAEQAGCSGPGEGGTVPRATKYWTGLSVQQGCSTLAASNKAPPSRGSAGRHEKEKNHNGIRQRSPGWGGGARRTPLQDPARQHAVSQPSLLQNGTAVRAAARQTQLDCSLAVRRGCNSSPLSRLSNSPHSLPAESRSQSSMSSWQRRRSAAFLGAGLLGLGRLLARTLANSMIEKLCATLESLVLARDQRRSKRACERECLYVLQNSVGRCPTMKTMSLNPIPKSIIYCAACRGAVAFSRLAAC